MTATFKLGMLGCGEQGWEFRIPAAQALAEEGVEVVAVADTDLKSARLVSRALGVPAAFGSLEAMIDRVSLDAIVVMLPAAEQCRATIYALERGLHVLCGHPFGSSTKEARLMSRAARRANRVLATGSHLPLQAGWSLRFARHGWLGTRFLLEAVWLRSVSASDRGIPDRPAFSKDPNGRGGGAAPGSHLLSVGLPLLGSPAISVTAAGWSHHGRAASGDEFRVEDKQQIVVYCVNGARGLFTAAWSDRLSADEAGLWCEGTEASMLVPLREAELDAEESRPTIVDAYGHQAWGEAPVSIRDAFFVQQRNWVQACRDEALVLSPPEDALLVHKVLDAADQSARRGGERVLII